MPEHSPFQWNILCAFRIQFLPHFQSGGSWMFHCKFNSSSPLSFYFILICRTKNQFQRPKYQITSQLQKLILIAPWNKWSTESGIESKSSGTNTKLPNTESNEPLFGAWQTGHSFGFTKQLWQEKCPQFVNEPGTFSPPGPQTRWSQIYETTQAEKWAA